VFGVLTGGLLFDIGALLVGEVKLTFGPVVLLEEVVGVLIGVPTVFLRIDVLPAGVIALPFKPVVFPEELFGDLEGVGTLLLKAAFLLTGGLGILQLMRAT
jgi:hypothetical protein